MQGSIFLFFVIPILKNQATYYSPCYSPRTPLCFPFVETLNRNGITPSDLDAPQPCPLTRVGFLHWMMMSEAKRRDKVRRR